MLCTFALFVVLQGLCFSIRATRGPAHAHRTASSIPALEDLRRGPAPKIGSPAWSRLGHHHDVAMRHHHAVGDAGVVMLDAERVTDAAAADSAGALDAATFVCLAVVTLALLWTLRELSHQRAVHVAWQPSFATARMPYRPPQAA